MWTTWTLRLACLGLTACTAQPNLAAQGEPRGTGAEEASDMNTTDTVRIERFSGRLVLIPGDGAEAEVVSLDPGAEAAPMPQVRREAGTLVVDGGTPEGGHNCIVQNGEMRIQLSGGPSLSLDDMPRLEIAVPVETALDLGMVAGDATMGPLARFTARLTSCTRLAAGDIAGEADLTLGGNSDVTLGSVETLTTTAGGGSTLEVDATRIRANLTLSGGARVKFGSVAGTLHATQGGGTRTEIASGRLDQLDLTLGGAARFTFPGQTRAARLTLEQASNAKLGPVESVERLQQGTAARLAIAAHQ